MQLNSELAAAKQSFQAGVDTLYSKCSSCGATPSEKTPTAISTAIQTIYNNRYNEGYNSGQSASKGYAVTQQYTYNWCNDGVTMTVNLTGCPWYRNASAGNIRCGIAYVNGHGGNGATIPIETRCQSYDPNSGIATIYIRGDILNPTILVCMIP